MMKSLYSGVSGLKVHNQRMDVIGNNIANVNTTAFKASTVTFKDIFYQTKTYASSGTITSGGTNPKQVGYGASLGTINQVMTQSGFTNSDSVYDMALSGDGFFQVADQAGKIYYSRNGVFNVDDFGNLVDPSGNIVLGINGDPTGKAAGSQPINLFVPAVTNNKASATKAYKGAEVEFSAAGYGPNGNLGITFVQSDSPFATLSGSSLTVMLDLTQDFGDARTFEDAVNSAIAAGGVNLAEEVIPLSIKIDGLPDDTSAKTAKNVMEFSLYTKGTAIGIDNTDTSAMAGIDAMKAYFKFETQTAGAFGNAYEIDMKVSSTATEPAAKWSGNVLTLTLPGKTQTKQVDTDGDGVGDKVDASGNPVFEEVLVYNGSTMVLLSDLKLAIRKAAGAEINSLLPSDITKGVDDKYTSVSDGDLETNFPLVAEYNVMVDELEALKADPLGSGEDIPSLKQAVLDAQATLDAATQAVKDGNPIDETLIAEEIAAKDALTEAQRQLDKAQTAIDKKQIQLNELELQAIYTGGDPQKIIMVNLANKDGDIDLSLSDPPLILPTVKQLTDSIGDNIRLLGMAQGADNFFQAMSKELGTVNMRDGRYAAEQGVDDLTLVSIDSDGTIYGQHNVHGTLILGRIDIATFENPIGLNQVGNSYWVQSMASGEPKIKIPGQDGSAEVVSGALEMSNVDLSQEFSDMIITQRGFQANSRIITVSDTMLEELINLKR
ncbi:MAG: flagellar hook-basal body complex protein [Oscillospiraceae bacterium]|jgi:flagellar hook-basal body protein|nr:flagellar hook-basal body complex protein [Oscillospiraceae bacterium]